ncbi:hypothetical protein NN561_016106 [Cricetulus griseus]
MLPLHRFPTGTEPPPIPTPPGATDRGTHTEGTREPQPPRARERGAALRAWIRAWNRPGRAHPPCRCAPSPWPCGAEPGAANLPGSGADRVTAPGSGLRLRAAARHDRLKLLCCCASCKRPYSPHALLSRAYKESPSPLILNPEPCSATDPHRIGCTPAATTTRETATSPRVGPTKSRQRRASSYLQAGAVHARPGLSLARPGVRSAWVGVAWERRGDPRSPRSPWASVTALSHSQPWDDAGAAVSPGVRHPRPLLP